MKLSLFYSQTENKLNPETYSQCYRDMFLALIERFGNVQHITNSCKAEDIKGDIVIIFDPHSSHHIEIDGLNKHKSIKYSFINDPHQIGQSGKYVLTGRKIRKLGRKQRIIRALKRGIDYFICPYTENYYQSFYRYLGRNTLSKLVWFPIAPDIKRFPQNTTLDKRKPKVLANGATWHLPEHSGYEFRKWAFIKPEVEFVPHYFYERTTPAGKDFPKFLSQYAGALALCDVCIVPKYSEIPMAGCVCFAQYQKDYERMGFRDGENCIYVDKKNFKNVINDFKANVSAYQVIADAGRKLMAENWTAQHFANHIWEHAKLQTK